MGTGLILALALAAPVSGEAVAHAGGAEVTAEELRGYLGTLPAEDRAAVVKDPSLLEKAVRGYLTRRAVLDVARAKGFDQAAAVKAQLDQVRENATVELYLHSVSEPPATYPAEKELQATYDAEAKRGGFQVPRQYRVAQIFVAANDEKGLEKVEAIARKLHEPDADFAAVARESTEEQGAAARGGEIGWLSEAQMVPDIRPQVVALAPGAVSSAVRLDDGWHILKLLEARAPRTRALAEVKDALIARMRAERAQASRQAYLSKLLEENPPTIDAAKLTRLLEKSP